MAWHLLNGSVSQLQPAPLTYCRTFCTQSAISVTVFLTFLTVATTGAAPLAVVTVVAMEEHQCGPAAGVLAAVPSLHAA